MKLSVSLSEDDVARLDDFARREGLRTRSAAVQEAIRRLRTAQLEADYEAAWQEWDSSADAQAWAPVDGDGLTASGHAAR